MVPRNKECTHLRRSPVAWQWFGLNVPPSRSVAGCVFFFSSLGCSTIEVSYLGEELEEDFLSHHSVLTGRQLKDECETLWSRGLGTMRGVHVHVRDACSVASSVVFNYFPPPLNSALYLGGGRRILRKMRVNPYSSTPPFFFLFFSCSFFAVSGACVLRCLPARRLARVLAGLLSCVLAGLPSRVLAGVACLLACLFWLLASCLLVCLRACVLACLLACLLVLLALPACLLGCLLACVLACLLVCSPACRPARWLAGSRARCAPITGGHSK